MKIGFFDTGLGGTTIFKEAYEKIDAEYIYLADTKNSPYGVKDKETVRNLTENCMKTLIDLGCEIIVIACNTATSAAISYLRDKYKDTIFIGAEPAIKPALEESNGQKIILTATSLTLKGEKLFSLLTKLNGVDKVSLLPLDELVEFADCTKDIQYDSAKEYLTKKFANMNLSEYSGIVLGCTHFPIFKNVFEEILPRHVKIYEPSEGITHNLINKMNEHFPNYHCSQKSVQLIMTEENKDFKSKFYNMLT